jgi:uncharacterized protein (TIGR02246 family)
MRSEMKCLILFAVTLHSVAQKQPDDVAVANLPKAFADAMTKHHGHELAKIMAGDVDFVTVGAMWLHGRSDFEKYHARLLSGRFSEATMTPLETRVRFLRPDIAVVHWSWRGTGDKNITSYTNGAGQIPKKSLSVVDNGSRYEEDTGSQISEHTSSGRGALDLRKRQVVCVQNAQVVSHESAVGRCNGELTRDDAEFSLKSFSQVGFLLL